MLKELKYLERTKSTPKYPKCDVSDCSDTTVITITIRAVSLRRKHDLWQSVMRRLGSRVVLSKTFLVSLCAWRARVICAIKLVSQPSSEIKTRMQDVLVADETLRIPPLQRVCYPIDVTRTNFSHVLWCSGWGCLNREFAASCAVCSAAINDFTVPTVVARAMRKSVFACVVSDNAFACTLSF